MADKIKVVIAEDNHILREHFCEMVAAEPDMEVVFSAESGSATTAFCTTKPYDVALLDIEMETPTAGIEAAKDILRFDPTAKLIFLTMHESDEMVSGAIELGAVDYIIKTEDESKILEHLRGAFNNAVHMDPVIQAKLRAEVMRLKKSESSLLFFINNISRLTPAEQELIKLLLDGNKVSEIAEIRCVELITVKTQIKTLLRKFHCKRTKEVTELIREMNLELLFYGERGEKR